MMIPTRSQSSSKKRNDHVLSGPSKTWRPALQSLIRRPPNNNVQRPRLERSRSRKFLFTNAWKRHVCDIAALLESVCRIRHHCAMCCPLHKSVSLPTTGHSSQADIYPPGAKFQWRPISRTYYERHLRDLKPNYTRSIPYRECRMATNPNWEMLILAIVSDHRE